MKILYVVDVYHPRLNGVVIFIDAALKYLAKQGHEVFLICPKGYPQEELFPSPIENIARIYRFESHPLWYSTNKEDRQVNRWLAPKINQTMKEIAPDLIHIHTEFNLGKLAKKFAVKNKIPSIATAHTYYLPYSYSYFPFLPKKFLNWLIPTMVRSFYKGIDLTLTPTEEMKKVLINEIKINSPVETLFIGIDTEDFKGIDREEERKSSFYFDMFPRWKTRKRLLFVGRMGYEKNVPFLLETFKLIQLSYPQVELIMVGAGTYLEEYRLEAEDKGFGNYITFTGPIPHEKLKNIYAIADIFTFPSLTETQGLVTVEALYNGLPVVAMNALGTKIVLERERGGFLVDNLQDFLNKTLLLLKDEKTYNLKQQEAFKRGEELTFDKTGESLEKIYQKVLSKYQDK